jgi:hypothetical protein
MGKNGNKYAFGSNGKTAFRLDHQVDSVQGRYAAFQDLFKTPPDQFQGKDIAVLNLLCAFSLNGSDKLNISKCIERLDRLAAFTKGVINRNLYRFPSDPDWGHCEPMWRMSHVVTAIKLDLGVVYNPELAGDWDSDEIKAHNAADYFVHGLLDDDRSRRMGTCASIPVLVTAVARRLGYPVKLVVAGRHVFARWDGDGVCFNIEASNPAGMTVLPNDDYRKRIRQTEKMGGPDSPYYLRSLSPAEEFGLFLSFRTECLMHEARYEETLLWSARSLQFAPDDPAFPHTASYAADLALKHRLWRRNPNAKIPRYGDPDTVSVNLNQYLQPDEFAPFMTIAAHFDESVGDITSAHQLYEDACRHHFMGHNEQRDLQIFIRKHSIPPKQHPSLMPQNRAHLRQFGLTCGPEEEGHLLMQLAHQFEVQGQPFDACMALHDLYLIDPSHSGVFLRARALEQTPEFQEQLKLRITNRQTMAQANVSQPLLTGAI